MRIRKVFLCISVMYSVRVNDVGSDLGGMFVGMQIAGLPLYIIVLMTLKVRYICDITHAICIEVSEVKGIVPP